MDRNGRAKPAHALPTGCTHYAHRQPVTVGRYRSDKPPGANWKYAEARKAARRMDAAEQAGRAADGA